MIVEIVLQVSGNPIRIYAMTSSFDSFCGVWASLSRQLKIREIYAEIGPSPLQVSNCSCQRRLIGPLHCFDLSACLERVSYIVVGSQISLMCPWRSREQEEYRREHAMLLRFLKSQYLSRIVADPLFPGIEGGSLVPSTISQQEQLSRMCLMATLQGLQLEVVRSGTRPFLWTKNWDALESVESIVESIVKQEGTKG